ncbi:Hypothetical protein NTJ_10214 [Nesidiocoris tenuis]|uniref:DUF4794 domain-containing protein n=1 Tax=Nesidiocoris tenuis TaxID=355587 RepID=A0ABN7AZ12_9HEMI|nr:Hypothetical protein NTJ_10214 [Nesidiocoris tenuis]
MRLLALAVLAAVGVAVANPGRIIVDENTRKDMIADGSAHLRPFAAPPLVFREERVHGEVTVLSPPLYVRGPPKGFPFSRWRPKRQVASTATSSNTTTTTSTARPTTPDRVHGEVIVQTSFISVGRPAKGQESRSRKTRDVSDEPRNEGQKLLPAK